MDAVTERERLGAGVEQNPTKEPFAKTIAQKTEPASVAGAGRG